ncbi:MAG: polysaccharide pyruvyl transferase family protein [Pseudomonadota bacterium]
MSGFCNAGDALGPIVTAALTGRPVAHVNMKRATPRLATIGTIAQAFSGGVVHLWGTGLDRRINLADPGAPWAPQPDTVYVVHALRGPVSGAAFAAHGITVPQVWGDPGYLAPRLWPDAAREKTHDLGVVLHLSELDGRGPGARAAAALKRYRLPEAWRGRVRLITMDTPASVAGVAAKTAEIASCRRILTTSLHGFVLADAYGVPAAWFGSAGHGAREGTLDDPAIGLDHRFRDLLAGIGRDRVNVFMNPRDEETDWAAALDMLDGVSPTGFDAAALLSAFPDRAVAAWGGSAPAPWPDPQPLLGEL